jgi:hypothetical protein
MGFTFAKFCHGFSRELFRKILDVKAWCAIRYVRRAIIFAVCSAVIVNNFVKH